MHLKEPVNPFPDTTGILTTTTTTKDTALTTKRGHKYPRPLYFAYGSNLSPTQMRNRCAHNPTFSSKPLAISKLNGWRWFICEAGYANILPPAEYRVGRQETDGAAVPISGKEDAVYGVLYEMSPEDELLLDGYEGVDYDASDSKSTKVDKRIRPREQGSGEYNKWYFPAVVTRWLDGDEDDEDKDGNGNRDGSETKEQTVLVYIDEERVSVGPPRQEYIGRMNRGIQEAASLGFPKEWAKEVMRKFIPDV